MTDAIIMSDSQHRFEVYEIVKGMRKTLHVTDNKLDALRYYEKFSDCAHLYLEEVTHVSLVYDLNDDYHGEV